MFAQIVTSQIVQLTSAIGSMVFPRLLPQLKQLEILFKQQDNNPFHRLPC